jgi:hypothetical protein
MYCRDGCSGEAFNSLENQVDLRLPDMEDDK